jgi:large subunit ribosomal protein L4
MAIVDVYNLQREKVGEIQLSDDVFRVAVKKHILHQVVVSQLASRRSGTASTKGRSDVKASGRKLWRQKGTGRARVGDAASPTRRGGGIIFGPKPRQYDLRVPKKVKKSALRMALSDKLQGEQLIVVDSLSLAEAKTKSFVAVMDRFDVAKGLIVTDEINERLDKSSRNVPWVKVLRREGLNVYDILNCDQLVLEQATIAKIEEALIS